MNKWISVKERVPEEWRPVLAVEGPPFYRMVEVAVYVGNGEWKVTWNHDQLKKVTYWMPLPELPELNEGQPVRTGCEALIKIKIRLVPICMAVQIARVRRIYKQMSYDVSLECMLHHVPFRWFNEFCYLSVVDINADGDFVVLDFETGKKYSIPAWMVSDIVKDIQEVS